MGTSFTATPARRFVARVIDYLAFVCVIGAVLLLAERSDLFRRSYAEHIILSSIATLFLWVPIEALQLAVLNTTLGKWLCDLRLSSTEGHPIGAWTAFDPSLSVFALGLSGGIPGANLLTVELAYRDLIELEETQWDRGKYRVEAGSPSLRWRFLIGAMILALLMAWSAILNRAQ